MAGAIKSVSQKQREWEGGELVVVRQPDAPLSFMEKAVMQMAHLRGINPAEILQSPLLEMLRPLSRLFDKTALDEDQVAALLGRVREEMHQQARLELTHAHVGSFSELRRKEEMLCMLQAQGADLFFSQAENISLMLQRDLAMLQACKGAVAPEERRLVEDFWHRVENKPEVFQEVSVQLNELLMDLTAQWMKILPTLNPSSKKAGLVKELREKIGVQLAEKREKIAEQGHQYLVLIGDLIIPSFANYLLRKFADNLAKRQENEIEHMSGFWRPFYERSLARDQAELSEQIEKQKKAQNALEDSETDIDDREHLERMLHIHKSFEGTFRDACARTQHILDNFDAEMHEMYGDPEETRRQIPPATVYESALVDLVGFSRLAESAGNPSLQLELEGLTPAYFADKLRDEAEAWRDRLASCARVTEVIHE